MFITFCLYRGQTGIITCDALRQSVPGVRLPAPIAFAMVVSYDLLKTGFTGGKMISFQIAVALPFERFVDPFVGPDRPAQDKGLIEQNESAVKVAFFIAQF